MHSSNTDHRIWSSDAPRRVLGASRPFPPAPCAAVCMLGVRPRRSFSRAQLALQRGREFTTRDRSPNVIGAPAPQFKAKPSAGPGLVQIQIVPREDSTSRTVADSRQSGATSCSVHRVAEKPARAAR